MWTVCQNFCKLKHIHKLKINKLEKLIHSSLNKSFTEANHQLNIYKFTKVIKETETYNMAQNIFPDKKISNTQEPLKEKKQTKHSQNSMFFF